MTGSIEESLRSRIGAEGQPFSIEIDRSIIARFTEAVEDNNPLWQEGSKVNKSRYGSLVAPPSLIFSAMFSGDPRRPELPRPYQRTLDGMGEWELLEPVKLGDVITSVTKFVGFETRQGKSGEMLFFFFETCHRNQNDEVVAISRSTLINLP
jgi:hypothetical protein